MFVTALFKLLVRFLFRRGVIALLLATTIVYAAKPSASDEFTDRRLTIGARIFRALLAADVDLDRKTAGGDELKLCLLYLDDSTNAEVVAGTLSRRDDPRIRGKEIQIESLPYAECLDDPADHYVAVFLTQRLNDAELSRLVTLSSRRNLIVFSPFEGDIERGVQSGIAVEARVRPYLNLTALRNAGIELKSFFMEVAKKHE